MKIILVATIHGQDVEKVKTYMTKVKVDNEIAHWNRQGYVIDAIDRLYDECNIDEKDKDYKKGKNLAVDSYFGAQLANFTSGNLCVPFAI